MKSLCNSLTGIWLFQVRQIEWMKTSTVKNKVDKDYFNKNSNIYTYLLHNLPRWTHGY